MGLVYLPTNLPYNSTKCTGRYTSPWLIWLVPCIRHGFGTRRVSAFWGAWAGPRFLVEAKAKAKAKVEKPVVKRPAKAAGQGELGKLKEFLQVGALNFEICFFFESLWRFG